MRMGRIRRGRTKDYREVEIGSAATSLLREMVALHEQQHQYPSFVYDVVEQRWVGTPVAEVAVYELLRLAGLIEFVLPEDPLRQCGMSVRGPMVIVRLTDTGYMRGYRLFHPPTIGNAIP